MPTESDKFDALVDFCESTLTAVKAGLNVSKRFRAARTGQKSERQDVMGDPPYYLEVDREGYRPDVDDDATRPSTASYQPDHEYGIRLWLGYKDTTANNSTWDDLVEGSQGLIKELRLAESIDYNGDRFYPKLPREVQEAVVNLSNRQASPPGDLARYLECSILVGHNE